MGVRGLKSFIDNNSDLLRTHKLYDSYLVIDGCNLQHSLYWRSSLHTNDFMYGGDYSRYATIVTQFFKFLQCCKIRPIVVLDGGIDPSLIKIKTVIERLKQRLESAKQISKHNKCADNEAKVLPLLAHNIFVAVMDECGVSYVQSTYEADCYIATIANALNCPVMSNDSDFYIFELTSGFIPFDSIDKSWTALKQCDDNGNVLYKYIDCNYYHINQLIEYFPGLSTSVLPLFSALMGNDYVSAHVFDNIFSAIPDVSVVGVKKSKSLRVGTRHMRIVKLLDWLRNRTLDEAIDFLVNFLRKNSRNNAVELLKKSLESYSSWSSRDYRNKYADKTQIPSSDSSDAVVKQFLKSIIAHSDDALLPEWFINDFHLAVLPPVYMNVIKLKLQLLSPQIEDFSLKSAWICAFELWKYVFGLLRLTHETHDQITVYCRVNNSIMKNSTNFYVSFPKSDRLLPNLDQLSSMNREEKRLLFLSILDITEDTIDAITNLFFDPTLTKVDVNGAVILLIVMKYWITNSGIDEKISIEFIYALITNILFFGHIGSYTKTKFVLHSGLEANTLKQLLGYTARPQHSRAKVYESRVIHYFSQFQVCLKVITSINSLLSHPFDCGQPFICLNGVFLYNLTTDLLSSARNSDPLSYLTQIFGEQSSAKRFLIRIFEIVLDGIVADKYVRYRNVSNRKFLINRKKTITKNTLRLENKFSTLSCE